MVEQTKASVKSKLLSNYSLLLAVVFGGFLIFGFSENVKGPAIPRMQSDFSLSEMQIGLLLALNSLGYLLACTFTGALARRFGVKTTTIIAFAAMALSGLFIYWAANYTTLSLSYFFMYIGNGLLEIALAILAARIFTRNTGMMMNLSHFFYGLSSMVAPLLAASLMGVQLFGSELGWRGMYALVLALSVLPMIPALFARVPGDEMKPEERLSLKSFIKDRAAWLIVGMLSFGVVSELAVGGWLVNYLEKVYGWSSDASAAMLSAFFLCFMLARLLLGPLTDRFGYTRSIIVLSAVSGLCSVGAIVAGESGAFLFALAGIGIAPIYPTVMALLAKRYSNGTETAITFTVTMMGVASVIGNFLIGAITDLFKGFFRSSPDAGLAAGLQAGYGFIAACALLCSVVAVMLYRYMNKRGELL
ncbi:MFS transporter [Paenibacillus radicis (ex Gao et al. 2016)]|uniref:MFS transporter n=1 Tax=Paenibacillus radicis (ex Gao et al. 2016) TaxID=1737354 RepID=A0A917HD50_9BACL|nr:MFS transporter [Paenibacillus radicis (ex Gao et al. 2016)]GGG75075.1 MFS transporter [Paenibacillus radicis (ex Gao et al. 2016)]